MSAGKTLITGTAKLCEEAWNKARAYIEILNDYGLTRCWLISVHLTPPSSGRRRSRAY